MTARPAHHIGYAQAGLARRQRASARTLTVIAALFGLLLAVPAFAANTLQDVSSTQLPDGKVQLTLKFAQPASAPNAFSTATPPRIALDFADTHNALSQRRVATVRDALIQAGVPADRIETGTFGTDRFMCNSSTEQCSQREGRVVKVIRRKNPAASQIVYQDALQVAIIPLKQKQKR